MRLSTTLVINFGTKTKGASRISVPSLFLKNEKATISADRLFPSVTFAKVRCFCSLARDICTLNTFSHLRILLYMWL